MKNSIYIMDPIDTEKERIKICHSLKDINPIKKQEYMLEIKERERKLFVRKEKTRIEQNKIYVDIDGVKKILEKELKDDYDRLNHLIEEMKYQKNADIVALLETVKAISVEQNIGYNKALNSVYLGGVPQDEIDNLFKKIIEISRDIFVKNEHYGLDVYLSTKIRHGTLSNHLRKPLEKENLITVRDMRKNAYLENQYWQQELYLLADQNELSAIQNALKLFSETHDDLIKYITSKLLQVDTTPIFRTDIEGNIITNENEEALFKYKFSNLELKKMLYNFLDDRLLFEPFIAYLIQILWDKTDTNLKEIRNILEQKIKQKILNNFDQLQDNLANIHSDINKLKNSIAKARTEINQSLVILIAWFGRMENLEKRDFEIRDTIDIVQNIFDKQQVYLECDIDTMPFFKGNLLDGFIDIFFILFDNAFKHSGLNDETKIKIQITNSDNKISIKISNNVIAESKSLQELNHDIQILQKDYGSQQSKTHLHKEGNTGFFKIWKILTKDLSITNHEMIFQYVQNETKEINFVVNLDIDSKGLFV